MASTSWVTLIKIKCNCSKTYNLTSNNPFLPHRGLHYLLWLRYTLQLCLVPSFEPSSLMGFLREVLKITCPSQSRAFISSQNWHEGQEVDHGENSQVCLGQTYHPLPIFSEPVATPPVGQHGKFQLETVTSHKAVKTKPGNTECREERVHWPAVFLFSQRAPFPFP